MGQDANAAVLVLGLGWTGCAALQALLERGIDRFLLADTQAVLPLDWFGNTLFDAGDRGRPRADVIRERLQPRHPSARFEVISNAADGIQVWLPGALGRSRFCVLAADLTSSPEVLSVNASCLAHAVPLLPGLMMGAVAQVGPLVRVGHACLGCLDVRTRAVNGRPAFAFPVWPDLSLSARVGEALAEEATRWFRDDHPDSALGTLRYLWSNGAGTRHTVLRSVHCPTCGTIKPLMPYHLRTALDLGRESRSDPRRILGLADRLVDSVTGPIRELTRYEPGPDDPQLRHCVSTLAEPGWAAFGRATVYCGGTALSEEAATAAALGEAIERASAPQPEHGRWLVARYVDLSDDAIDPRDFDLYLPETRAQPGFPYIAPSRDVPMTWVWGHSLTRDRSVLVPASRIFSPFRATAPGDYFDAPLISGFAAGVTREDATLGALLEVIERDAFMIAWANRLSGTGVPLDADAGGELGAYVGAFQRSGLAVRCTVLLLDLGVPVVVAIVRSTRPNDPASVVAAAADPDLYRACCRALRELAANRLSVRQEMLRGPMPLEAPTADQVVDETAHGLLYARADMASHLDHWWNAPGGRPVQPAAAVPADARLRSCVQSVARARLEVLLVDLTPPELEELGLHAVKVVVPGTYPMNFDSRWRHHGGNRMTGAPVAAKLRSSPLRVEDLNPVPHPFP